MDLEEFICLNLLVPPKFEAALGYEGDARFVAFYWEPAGDELMYTNGQISANGEYAPWILWRRHIATAPTLFGYDFGSSDTPARHWLLLDREDRRFYVGEADQVARFFHQLPEAIEAREAWEALDPEERKRLQTEAWGSVQEAMKRMPQVTMADIEERVRNAHRLYRKLSVWLDQQAVVCPSCDHSYPAGAWNGNSHSCPGCGAIYWIGIAVG
jgi:hypothetical protein